MSSDDADAAHRAAGARARHRRRVSLVQGRAQAFHAGAPRPRSCAPCIAGSTTPPRCEAQIRESEAAHPVGLLGDVVGAAQRRARGARQHAGHRAQRVAALDGEARGRRRTRSRRGARLGSARARLAPAAMAAGTCCATCRCRRICRRVITASKSISNARAARVARSSSRRTSATNPRISRAARKLWGVAVQLYALRSREQLGHRRFLRPRRAAAPRRRGGRRFRRHQPGARAVSVGSHAVFAVLGLEPSCAERHVHRRGGGARSAGLAPRAGASWRTPGFARGSTQVRAATQVDYPAVASLKMTGAARRPSSAFAPSISRGTPRAPRPAARSCASAASRCACTPCSTRIDGASAAPSRHRRGLAQLAGGIPRARRRSGAALRAGACRRSGFPRLPAVARGRAVRRGARSWRASCG